jgi:hypothetical protein
MSIRLSVAHRSLQKLLHETSAGTLFDIHSEDTIGGPLFVQLVKFLGFFYILYTYGCTRWRNWLRHYAKSRKAAGSIPDEVTGFFN